MRGKTAVEGPGLCAAGWRREGQVVGRRSGATRRGGDVVAVHLRRAFVARGWPVREMVRPRHRTCGRRSHSPMFRTYHSSQGNPKTMHHARTVREPALSARQCSQRSKAWMDPVAQSAEGKDVALATSSEDGPARVSIARSPPCPSERPFRADRILASFIVVSPALWAESRLCARFRISELFRRVCTPIHGRRVHWQTRSSVQHCNASESSMVFAHHLVTISEQPPFAGSEGTPVIVLISCSIL